MPLAMISLFLGAFCIGTTEFILAGLLPAISEDMAVSIPTASYLISAYAITVALGGPFIILAIAHFPRKLNILALMSVFVVGHVWCALAPTFEWLLAARVFVALSHSSFLGIAAVIAISIVPANKRGSAISLLFAGIMVSNVIGVPIGTAIGNWLGWRASFWIIGAAAVLSTIAMMILIPKQASNDQPRPSLRTQISALGNQKVLLGYVMFALQLGGFWIVFSFIAPLLLTVTQVSPEQVPMMLLVFGLGATVGTLTGGQLADRAPTFILLTAYPMRLIAFGAILIFATNATLMPFVMFTFGLIVFLAGATVASRIITGASKAPEFASTLISAAANIGISGGTYIGAQLLSAGVAYEQLPWGGIVIAIISTAVAVLTISLDRKAKAAAG